MSSYPQIDYTSRDFLSLVQDMGALADKRMEEWLNRSQNDFGQVLIELLAYEGDILGYYGDRIANESYLSTATQRESVLQIARMLDYYPSGPIAASVPITFANKNSGPVWLLAGTQVATVQPVLAVPNPSKPFQSYAAKSHAPVVFETVTDVLVPANGSLITTAVEGVTYRELTGTSDGTLDQDFALYRSPVIEGSVSVTINSTTWAYYERLADAYSTSRAYTLETDGEGTTHVLFGDGANGAVPPAGAAIDVTYRVGGGARGNIATGAISRVLSTPIGSLAGISVSNPDLNRVRNSGAGKGGADPESIEEIKDNAPRSLFTLQRAISTADYVSLGLRVAGVAKVAVPPSNVYSSVVMYVAPRGGQDATFDGSGNPLTSYKTLQQTVFNYLADKIPLGTTLTMAPPVYSPVQLAVTLTVKPKYVSKTVQLAATNAVVKLFDFPNVTLGDTITVKDVHTALATVAGLSKVNITMMTKSSISRVVLDQFDTALTGTGWNVSTAYNVSEAGTGSNYHTGTGDGTRTFASPLDLSKVNELEIRGSYAGPGRLSSTKPGYLQTTLTLLDESGNTLALGMQSHGAIYDMTPGMWNAARWKVVWPDDLDDFDPTRVSGYTVHVVPRNIPSNTFYLDDLVAYISGVGDINFYPYELPARFTGTSAQSTCIFTTVGGIQ